MKHFLKETVINYLILSVFSLLAAALLAPLVFMLLSREEFPTYFSLFSGDYSSVWIAMVLANTATSVIISFFRVMAKVKRAKMVVSAMATSNVTFVEALILVSRSYRSSENPNTWNKTQFNRDLWKLREIGVFK